MRKNAVSTLLLLGSVSLFAGVSFAHANEPPAAPATINVGYFTRGPVMQMAQAHGFFADEKLTVNEIKTAGSTLLLRTSATAYGTSVSTWRTTTFSSA